MSNNTDGTRLVTVVLIIVAAFVIFPMFSMSFGLMGFGPMMGGMSGGGMWADGTMPDWVFFAGIVMQLLFVAAIMGGAYLIYRAVAGAENDTDQALEELRLAYARGELTDEEYEQRREALERDI